MMTEASETLFNATVQYGVELAKNIIEKTCPSCIDPESKAKLLDAIDAEFAVWRKAGALRRAVAGISMADRPIAPVIKPTPEDQARWAAADDERFAKAAAFEQRAEVALDATMALAKRTFPPLVDAPNEPLKFETIERGLELAAEMSRK